jgi:two-component system OmpR family response regulator
MNHLESAMGTETADSGLIAPRILLVDDDSDLRSLIGEVLATAGFEVVDAKDGVEMRLKLAGQDLDLVVLDLNLPKEDGLALCRELRALGDMPVIMLTARADPIDRIVGLELGADDYITKPFEPRELLARIRTVLRRLSPAQRQGEVKRISGAVFEGWRLDFDHRHLVDPDGMLVMLSGAEYALLRAMIDHPQSVLSREHLQGICNARDLSGRAIDLQISRVRQKLRDDARPSPLIKTVRGEGYVFAAPVSFK